MAKQLRDMMGGALRPSDPRRFLIEAMIGAVHADGEPDDREMRVLHEQIHEHDLFAGMNESAVKMLVELATDAVTFAGKPVERVGAIARGLPSRTHRLAAFAMACEVCSADDDIDEAEQAYLEALRVAMRVGKQDAEHLESSVKSGRSLKMLEKKVSRLQEFVPRLVDLFALRACHSGVVTDEDRDKIKRFLSGLDDVAVRGDELDAELQRSLGLYSVSVVDLDRDLGKIAEAVTEPVDRYWAAVYLITAELQLRGSDYQDNEFISALARAFELDDDALREAATDAQIQEVSGR